LRSVAERFHVSIADSSSEDRTVDGWQFLGVCKDLTHLPGRQAGRQVGVLLGWCMGDW